MNKITTYFSLLLSFSILLNLSGYTQAISDRLVFYYPFHGSSIDESANGYHAVAMGPELVSDRKGIPDEAYHFDGIDDYILIPDLDAIECDFPVSFAFWTKLDTLNIKLNQFIGTDQRFNDYNGFRISTSSDNLGSIVVNYGNGYGAASSFNRVSKISDTTLTTGKWYHVASVLQSPYSVKIFINGVNAGGYIAGEGDPFVAYSEDGQPKIGIFPGNLSSPETNYLLGALDDVAMWHRALSDQEILNLYQDDLLGNDVFLSKETPQFQVFPNPAKNNLNLSIPSENDNGLFCVEIIAVNGSVIKSRPRVSPGIITFSVSDIKTGLYMIRVSGNEKVYFTKRFIKQ
ncbi:MAG: T9SS type A sorting domain-containing protein [Bacteroidia bacterium]|nr:T9SS type A sorting domain-containing protein [Bacteroidales bacterium]MDD3961674.1 T9SS type A sorting domain-containing protein [Bacteroidales bacterium]NCD41275.1 T9SS type A sorting domain-containing protein [Bacteroidia bacterium]